jgi:hypothetical protein
MLPWDQVPPEHRAIGDLATPLDDELGLMNVHLAVWMARDDSKADASVVRAGNQVIDSIDAMLRQLYQLRARMVAERREDQDTAAARVDAMLAARQAAADITAPPSGEPAACPDHRPVLDSAVGWYCPACGSDAPPHGSETDGGQP